MGKSIILNLWSYVFFRKFFPGSTFTTLIRRIIMNHNLEYSPFIMASYYKVLERFAKENDIPPRMYITSVSPYVKDVLDKIKKEFSLRSVADAFDVLMANYIYDMCKTNPITICKEFYKSINLWGLT